MAIKNIEFKNTTFEINYSLIDNKQNQNIAFLHGWGSNKELMHLAFKDSFKNFNHIYIDLPGFGKSDNQIFLNSFNYAEIINLFLKKISINEIKDCKIVVGHSFGGKISLLLEREIILLSSAGILLPKSFGIRFKIKLAKILKLFGLKSFNFLKAEDAKNLSPIMYEIFKHIVNENFIDQYKNFKHKKTIFWGRNDRSTPIQAFEIIKNITQEKRVKILEGDHYFFLKQGNLIEKFYNDFNF